MGDYGRQSRIINDNGRQLMIIRRFTRKSLPVVNQDEVFFLSSELFKNMKIAESGSECKESTLL
nr:MAG TPA: hypothetical protein [Caudoviricetes sp.]